MTKPDMFKSVVTRRRTIAEATKPLGVAVVPIRLLDPAVDALFNDGRPEEAEELRNIIKEHKQ